MIKIFQLLLLLNFAYTTVSAQTEDPSNFTEVTKICFDEEIVQNIQVVETVDLDALSIFDKQKFVESKEIQHCELRINENGFFENETVLTHHENVFPEWYSPPFKIKYNEQGMFSYFETNSEALPGGWVGASITETDNGEYRSDSDGAYLYTQHSEESLLAYELENDQFQSNGVVEQFLFRIPDEAMISDLENDGFDFESDDGKLIFTKANIFIEYDLVNHQIKTVVSEAGQIEYTQWRKYAYNSVFDDVLLSDVSIEVPQVFDNGDCFSEVIHTTYSNFSISCDGDEGETRQAKSELEDQVSVYPNPVHSTLNVEVPPYLFNGKIKIFNAARQLMKWISIDESGRVECDVKDLLPGMYIISVEKEDRVILENFLKQ